MKPEADCFEESNKQLAQACQATCSSCCKKGLLFLLPEEKAQIEEWISSHSPDEMGVFHSSLTKKEGFYLFDQKNSCQFLDQYNLCRLHGDGVKPTECFLWPAHVYVGLFGNLETQVSNTCCEGYRYITEGHPAISGASQFADRIGYERLLRFRKAYGGSYGHNLLENLPHSSPFVRPLKIEELGRYRSVGEKFFPEENWDAGMIRLEGQLRKWGSGIQIYESNGEILGYATLWPLSRPAACHLESGLLLDAGIDGGCLDPQNADAPQPWIMTAIGVTATPRDQRRIVILSLLNALYQQMSAGKSHRIYAHAATEDGRRFLQRMNFCFRFPKLQELGVMELLK
jgi:hypothetical protein